MTKLGPRKSRKFSLRQEKLKADHCDESKCLTTRKVLLSDSGVFGTVSEHPCFGAGARKSSGTDKVAPPPTPEVDCRSQRLRGLMADRCWSASERVIILEIVTAVCL